MCFKRGAFTSLLYSLPIKGKKYLSCCLFLCAKHALNRALRVRLLRLRARRNEGKMKRERGVLQLGLNTLNINWLFLREKVKRSVYARTTLPLSFSLCLAWISLSSSSLGWWSFRVRSFVSVFLSVCRLKENEREGDILKTVSRISHVIVLLYSYF